MKRSSTILIALMIVVPLIALGWAMTRIAQNEQIVVQQRFQELMEDRLRDVNANISMYFESVERDLSGITAIDNYAVDSLRQTHRRHPRLLQLFVLGNQGQLIYPDPMEASGPLNGNERRFLIEAAKMFTGQDLKEAVIRAEQSRRDPSQEHSAGGSSAEGSSSNDSRAVPTAATPFNPNDSTQKDNSEQQDATSFSRAGQSYQIDLVPQGDRQRAMVNSAYQQAAPVRNLEQFREVSGWFVWYWDRGVNLIYWQRRPSGDIVGGALERARWMADLIAQLPDTLPADVVTDRTLDTRIRLVNESGQTVYQWGKFEPGENAEAFCEVPVAAPLTSWRLQCFLSEDQLTADTGQSASFSLVAVLAAVALMLGICGFMFIREYSRDMREAAQQVSFVNQVSHELKTPLTNIRMYAELLERDLDHVESADTEKPRQRLEVILSEGQRLSRLIGNVLTFARQRRHSLQLQAHPESPGRLLRQIVDRFRPVFADQQLEIQLQCEDNSLFELDPDFLDQILGNLISNVEKYAASGGLLQITMQRQDQTLTIDVKDSGPGIPHSKRETVFEPFARISNDVSYAAGTGIGLSIARELARLHGGDLVLMDSSFGCWFRVTLKEQKR